jgi:hypothetical protein
MPFELLNPEGLERPVGYTHVAKVSGGNISLARRLLTRTAKS